MEGEGIQGSPTVASSIYEQSPVPRQLPASHRVRHRLGAKAAQFLWFHSTPAAKISEGTVERARWIQLEEAQNGKEVGTAIFN